MAHRPRWTLSQVTELFEKPLLDLLFEAQQVHRQHFDPRQVQVSTLLSIKTGACPEDCKYCPQSSRYKTGLEAERLMEVEQVLESARKAKAAGSTRFCMGAAWKNPHERDMPYLEQMVQGVKAMGLEACMTLGTLSESQAQRLANAGDRKRVNVTHTCGRVDFRVRGKRLVNRLRHELFELGLSLPCKRGELLLDLGLKHTHRPKTLVLMLDRGNVVVILRDAFGHIRENVLLDLSIKLDKRVRSRRQVFRRQHQPRLKGSAVDSTGHMLFATSSVSLYHLTRYSHFCIRPSRTSWRSRSRKASLSVRILSSKSI